MGIKNKDRYVDACIALLGGRRECDDNRLELLNAARDVDRLTAQLAHDARHMAERFAKYAEDIASGMSYVPSPPNGYSTLRDVDTNAAKLDAKLSSFFAIARIVLDEATNKKLRAAIDERLTVKG